MTKLNMEWFIAALIRAIKTVSQTALGMISVGAALGEINWQYVFSVALVAGIYSMLTSLAGLPEVGTDGVLQIDKTSDSKDIYRLNLTIPLENLASKKTVVLSVDPNASLSQEKLTL